MTDYTIENPIMRYFFGLLIGPFFLLSCAEKDTNDKVGDVEKDTKTEINAESTIADKTALFKKRDSLLAYFNFVKSEFDSPSYYNRAWWNRYWLREHILMAGLDSAGNYFLTMTTYFPPMKYLKNADSVEVVVYIEKDSGAITKSLC
jgi:hypothetical protein